VAHLAHLEKEKKSTITAIVRYRFASVCPASEESRWETAKGGTGRLPRAVAAVKEAHLVKTIIPVGRTEGMR
jgi:hypothetical protein